MAESPSRDGDPPKGDEAPGPAKAEAESDPLVTAPGLKRRTTQMGLAPAPHLGGLTGSAGAKARAEAEARKRRVQARLSSRPPAPGPAQAPAASIGHGSAQAIGQAIGQALAQGQGGPRPGAEPPAPHPTPHAGGFDPNHEDIIEPLPAPFTGPPPIGAEGPTPADFEGATPTIFDGGLPMLAAQAAQAAAQAGPRYGSSTVIIAGNVNPARGLTPPTPDTPLSLPAESFLGPKPARRSQPPPAQPATNAPDVEATVLIEPPPRRTGPPPARRSQPPPGRRSEPPPETERMMRAAATPMNPITPGLHSTHPLAPPAVPQGLGFGHGAPAGSMAPSPGGGASLSPYTPSTALALRTWDPGARHAISGPLDKRLVLLNDPESARAASFRVLRDGLIAKNLPRVLAISSASPNEGKTTCAINLSLAIAELSNTSVLLLDGNFHDYELAAIFTLDRLPSITPPEPVMVPYKIAQVAQSLHVAGIVQGESGERRFDQPKFDALLDRLCRAPYDYIIIDTPALLGSPTVAHLVAGADAALLTARSGSTTSRDLRRATGQLTANKALGVVLVDAVG